MILKLFQSLPQTVMNFYNVAPYMSMFNPPNLNEKAFYELKATNCYLQVTFSLCLKAKSGISN